MSMYMSDRRHVCAHVRILGLYRSTDYSWDMTSRVPKVTISTKCNTILYSFAYAIILPYPTFHLEYMYVFVHDFGRRDSSSRNTVLWIYSLPGSPADFRVFSHARAWMMYSYYYHWNGSGILLLHYSLFYDCWTTHWNQWWTMQFSNQQFQF